MKLWKLVFTIWIFFWLLFLIRGLVKGEFKEYKTLLCRAPEARRAYILGKGFYEFLNFTYKNIPDEATYNMAGALEPIDRYRLTYYLYPRRGSEDPEYILCYKIDKDFNQKGFYKAAVLDKDRFILKRR